jgi:hypothetical protein
LLASWLLRLSIFGVMLLAILLTGYVFSVIRLFSLRREPNKISVVLRADLHKGLERTAEQEARSVSDIVNQAVEHYLRERQGAKLDQEIAGYSRT